MISNLAPIVVFVYNRPWHTEQTLNDLMQNDLADQSVLFIYADGPKENATDEQIEIIKKVRQIIRNKQWCKEVHIIEAEINKGLADAIIDGVTKIVNEFGKVIVLEDDLVTSKYFLRFMNDALHIYESNAGIMQVNGYMFPIKTVGTGSAIILPMISSWGWATWKRAWDLFDPNATGYEDLKINKKLSFEFDLDNSYPNTQMLLTQMEENKINSWAIRWWWSVFKAKGLSIFPDHSLVNNIGFGKEATHTINENPFINTSWNSEYSIIHLPGKIKIKKKTFQTLKSYLKCISDAPEISFKSKFLSALIQVKQKYFFKKSITQWLKSLLREP